MSSSPLPVPSKAALTALRGLIVGTSCTLALVAEDRRRRINNAIRVIENGEKVKAARNYRAGGTEFAVALEQEALFGGATFSALLGEDATKQLSDRLCLETSGKRNKRKAREAEPELRLEAPTIAAPPRENRSKLEQIGSTTAEQLKPTAKPNPFIQSSSPELKIKVIPKGQLWPAIDPELTRAYTPPTIDEAVPKILGACDSQDPREIRGAVQMALGILEYGIPLETDYKHWIVATALLCRECQSRGWIQEAAKIFEKTVNQKGLQLEEEEYVSYRPMQLITSLVWQYRSQAHNRAERLGNAEQLTYAARLFKGIPNKCTIDSLRADISASSKQLIEALLSVGKFKEADTLVFRRVFFSLDLEGIPEWNSCELAVWFMRKLHEVREHKRVVRMFLGYYFNSPSNEVLVYEVGDIVLGSVESACHSRAADVLRKLLRICSGLCKLRTSWAIKLISLDWESHKDFEKVEGLFEELRADLEGSITHPDGAYRIMVELALKAGQEARAEEYLAKAAIFNPGASSDPRILGIFAKHHAKLGDWDGVRALFQRTNVEAETQEAGKARANAFVPVLKAFAETHSIRETDDFTRSYVDELQVPLCGYTVQLMAKHYGAVRDFATFMGWVRYCSQAGFEIDAHFTNSILAFLLRCRVSFKNLRHVFDVLSQLSPGSVDKQTARIMTKAALVGDFGSLRTGRVRDKAAMRRLRSLMPGRLRPAINTNIRTHNLQGHDLVLAMQIALVQGHPTRAISLWKRTLRKGAYDEVACYQHRHALQLAVSAVMKMSPDARGASLHDILRFAQQHGQEITHATNHIIALQLAQLGPTGSSGNMYKTVQSTLDMFEKRGIVLTDVALNRAADMCLKAGHPKAAIMYAQKAAESRGRQRYYNIHNLRILLGASVEMFDVEGVRHAIAGGLASDFKDTAGFLQTLKYARRRARKAPMAVSETQRQETCAIIQQGIEDAVGIRKNLREERAKFEHEAAKIMARAALDAGRPPGDIDLLGGKDDAAVEQFMRDMGLDGYCEAQGPLPSKRLPVIVDIEDECANPRIAVVAR
ncbi:hypothetical protein OQA88_12823 [Cercophora sp. LCS_1]